jgi:hypothetical protein
MVLPCCLAWITHLLMDDKQVYQVSIEEVLDHWHQRASECSLAFRFFHFADWFTVCVCCVFITAGPSTKMFTWGGGEDMGGHVLRETTSRGLCGLVCPSRTSERGGEGDCVKEVHFD